MKCVIWFAPMALNEIKLERNSRKAKVSKLRHDTWKFIKIDTLLLADFRRLSERSF